MKGESVKKFFD